MAKNILICDDAAFMRMMIKDILTKNGYNIVGEAENGAKAVEKYAELKPDLVLMDITMPEMDGIEATFRLRDKGVKTPIIAVTAFAFDQDRNRILEAGCDDYISKPIFSAILKERIRYWLNEKRKL